MRKFLVLFLAAVWASSSAFAAAPTFSSLTQTNLDDVVKEMSANFTFTSASAPSSFGKLLSSDVGFEVGLIGGITKTPKIQDLVALSSTSTKVDQLPHVGGFLALSFPYGIAVESALIPKTTVSGVSVSYLGLAARWTITDVFLEWLPIKWGTRFSYSKASFSYGQTINNSSTGNTAVAATVKIDDKVWGWNTSISYPFADNYIEPYIGLGYLSGNGTVTIDAATVAATLFTFTTAQTSSSTPKSAQFFGGVQFNLSVVHLGVEAMRAFGTNNYTAKLAFAF